MKYITRNFYLNKYFGLAFCVMFSCCLVKENTKFNFTSFEGGGGGGWQKKKKQKAKIESKITFFCGIKFPSPSDTEKVLFCVLSCFLFFKRNMSFHYSSQQSQPRLQQQKSIHTQHKKIINISKNIKAWKHSLACFIHFITIIFPERHRTT